MFLHACHGGRCLSRDVFNCFHIDHHMEETTREFCTSSIAVRSFRSKILKAE